MPSILFLTVLFCAANAIIRPHVFHRPPFLRLPHLRPPLHQGRLLPPARPSMSGTLPPFNSLTPLGGADITRLRAYGRPMHSHSLRIPLHTQPMLLTGNRGMNSFSRRTNSVTAGILGAQRSGGFGNSLFTRFNRLPGTLDNRHKNFYGRNRLSSNFNINRYQAYRRNFRHFPQNNRNQGLSPLINFNFNQGFANTNGLVDRVRFGNSFNNRRNFNSWNFFPFNRSPVRGDIGIGGIFNNRFGGTTNNGLNRPLPSSPAIPSVNVGLAGRSPGYYADFNRFSRSAINNNRFNANRNAMFPNVMPPLRPNLYPALQNELHRPDFNTFPGTGNVNWHRDTFFRDGSDFHENVWDSFDNVRDRIHDNFDNIRDRMHDNIDNVRDRINDNFDNVRDRIHDSFENVRDRIHDNFDNVRDRIHDNFDNVRDRIHDNFDNFRDRVQNNFEGIRDNFDNVRERIDENFENVRENFGTFSDDIHFHRAPIISTGGHPQSAITMATSGIPVTPVGRFPGIPFSPVAHNVVDLTDSVSDRIESRVEVAQDRIENHAERFGDVFENRRERVSDMLENRIERFGDFTDFNDRLQDRMEDRLDNLEDRLDDRPGPVAPLPRGVNNDILDKPHMVVSLNGPGRNAGPQQELVFAGDNPIQGLELLGPSSWTDILDELAIARAQHEALDYIPQESVPVFPVNPHAGSGTIASAANNVDVTDRDNGLGEGSFQLLGIDSTTVQQNSQASGDSSLGRNLGTDQRKLPFNKAPALSQPEHILLKSKGEKLPDYDQHPPPIILPSRSSSTNSQTYHILTQDDETKTTVTIETKQDSDSSMSNGFSSFSLKPQPSGPGRDIGTAAIGMAAMGIEADGFM